MAHARLAQGNEGTSEGLLRRRPRARRRRAAATDRRQGHAAHARRRNLARRRAARVRRAEILSGQPPCQRRSRDIGCDDPGHWLRRSRTSAATIKARWVCEQAHQQLKEELGLDHFEGRSWRGLHRHALMAMIAYAFLQHRRLAAASGGKKNRPRAAQRCRPYEKPSSQPWRALRPTNARIAADKSQIARMNVPK